MASWYEYSNNYFSILISFPALLPFKNVKFYFRSCQKPRKGDQGIVTLWRHTRNGVDAKTNHVGCIAEIYKYILFFFIPHPPN